MASIGTTHVNAWRGFNYGINDGSHIDHLIDGEDEQPSFIASARHFVDGHGANYSKPSISVEEE